MIRSSEHAALPLIAITARSVGDEETRVRGAGMNGLLRKPVTAAMPAAALAAAGVAAATDAPVD